MIELLYRYKVILISVFLILCTFVVYEPVTKCDFIKFDDDTYITNNLHVRSGLSWKNVRWAFGFTEIVYWMPLSWLSHIIDCHLFDLKPGLHHLTSLLIHIANTILLFAVLNRMTGTFWPSAFTAALFALHPVNVDSVAWLAERKNLLSTFFWLLTMLTYVYYIRKPNVFRYLLMIVVFILGLLSKPMLITLPFVLLLLDYWPLGRMSRKAGIIVEKLPLFALSAASMYLSSLSFKDPPHTRIMPMELRLANALVSYIKYILKLFWPTDLAILYPYPSYVPAWQSIGSLLLLICISAIVVLLMRKKPYLVTGWLWYTGTLVPVLGLVQIGLWPAMADRWLYVPSVGIFIMAVWGIYDLAGRRRAGKTLLTVLGVLVVLVLSIKTTFQLRYWRDSLTLFEHTLTITRDNYTMHNNYANVLGDLGRFDKALEQLNLSLKINPYSAEVHTNMGNVLVKVGKIDEAIKHYEKAIDLQPGFSEAHYNLAAALAKQGKTSRAVEEYLEALRLEPDNTDALSNLGFELAGQNKFDEAVKYYKKTLELEPHNIIAHGRLAMVLAGQGRIDEAIREIRIVLTASPRDAEMHRNLGILLERQGKISQAIEEYQQVLKIDPNETKTRQLLETVLKAQKNRSANDR